ncbi:MAG TPA: hypothetical protein VMS77_10005 [Conexivisphaerales archaeon]|nr:hypothetical protein [Conexivisphaerales archaeon]
MNCSEARAYLSQIDARGEAVGPIQSADLDYLSTNGYVLVTSKDDHDRSVEDVGRLSQLVSQVYAERTAAQNAADALQKDESREHSIMFHLEGQEKQLDTEQRVETEKEAVTKEESELAAMEANLNSLIQEKSTVDRMVPYGDGYLSLTDLGGIILSDLNVRNYRVADLAFPDFLAEIRSTYAELRGIADRASSYAGWLQVRIPNLDEAGSSAAPSLQWGTAIGLAKLQGDTNQIGERFSQSLNVLQGFDSTLPNKLMAAEVITATASQDVTGLEATLKDLNRQLLNEGVPKELSVGIATTMMAGRRFDGSYPLDRFRLFRTLTPSYEAASILAVMNLEYQGVSSEFQAFESMFSSWGFMKSEDTEIASAYLAIGGLAAGDVGEKLKYIIEQLRNYLEYPLVAAAILASIPVFEAHEVLDLMEKGVTLLSGYAQGLERSELVALSVRMIHGVRNELVRQIDPTATVANVPVQFTYPAGPGMFSWYYPVIIAHSYYHATFSGMGGFHPAHSHGIGGFAG